MSHINLFQTNAEFLSAYNGSDYVEPWVSYTMETSGVSFNKEQTPPAHDYSQDYLTFKVMSAGTIVWKSDSTAYTTTISYSKDNGSTWIEITSNTGNSAPSISVVSGDTVLFKGNNITYKASVVNDTRYCTFSGSTCQFVLEGNIMSLVYGDNFIGQTSLPQESAQTFGYLFCECTGLTSTENLILPATVLTQGCYYRMFLQCTNLTTAPELPATTLTHSCYFLMFNGCTSLTTGPELPATTLANGCYDGMFSDCTSLTTGPELPATTLANDCYACMFSDCTSLTTAPELPVTTLADGCYRSMFNGCTSLTTAPSILPATTLADSCYDSMFSGCTSLTTAPELPATTLTHSCYEDMFNGCTSLTTAPVLPATTLAEHCYWSMFEYCTNLTTAPELPAPTLVDGCYFKMFYGCNSLNYIKCLATDISAEECTDYWVGSMSSGSGSGSGSDVSPTGTFVKAASMNDWERGGGGIPEGWDVEDAS